MNINPKQAHGILTAMAEAIESNDELNDGDVEKISHFAIAFILAEVESLAPRPWIFHDFFKVPPYHYRINTEPKKGWYRVALVKNNVGRFYTTTADCEISEKEWMKDSRFIEWLGDRIEYTLPEGDA